MFEILEEKLLTSLPIPPTLPGFKCVSILVPPVKPVECSLFYMPLVCYIFTTSCNFLCKTGVASLPRWSFRENWAPLI